MTAEQLRLPGTDTRQAGPHADMLFCQDDFFLEIYNKPMTVGEVMQ